MKTTIARDGAGRRRAAASAALGAALLFALAAGCSSAPKGTGESYAVRNKAAEYSKLADQALGRGEYDTAVKIYREALEADSSIDNVAGAAGLHASLGRAYLAAGLGAQAEREFASAIEYARISGARSAAALATAGLGELLYSKGDREGALARFEEALGLASGDEAAAAVALHDAATAKAALGREAEAEADLAKAASINRKLKRPTELASNHYVLASIRSRAGDFPGAMTAILAALESDKKAENGPGIAQDLAAAASISLRAGKKQEAYDYWTRSFDTALAANRPESVRKALAALSGLAAELGRDNDAARYAELLARLDAAEAAPASPASDKAAGKTAAP
jgi:tetratricopeptide (TPR) repeat protein